LYLLLNVQDQPIVKFSDFPTDTIDRTFETGEKDGCRNFKNLDNRKQKIKRGRQNSHATTFRCKAKVNACYLYCYLMICNTEFVKSNFSSKLTIDRYNQACDAFESVQKQKELSKLYIKT